LKRRDSREGRKTVVERRFAPPWAGKWRESALDARALETMGIWRGREKQLRQSAEVVILRSKLAQVRGRR